ncbi:MAG TPA: hypothetical protein VNZ86_16760 [Bacteroidia bacterium]|jgi:hypothetical protein|nr:hypothetical protein [Bacteroidia bacterium]
MTIFRGVGRYLAVLGALLIGVTACKEEKKPLPALKSLGAQDLDITLLKAFAEYDKEPEADQPPHYVYVFRIKNHSGAEQKLFVVDSNGFSNNRNMEIVGAPVADSVAFVSIHFPPLFDNLHLKPYDSIVVYGFGSRIYIPPFIAKNLLVRHTEKSVFLFRYASPDTLIAEHRADYKLIRKSTGLTVDTVSTEAGNFKAKIKEAETGK